MYSRSFCLLLNVFEININLYRKVGAIIGDNVKVGINCSIMPGVKIGSSCMVGPSIVLYNDVSKGCSVFLKQDQIVRG